jgi:uncharacterized protein
VITLDISALFARPNRRDPDHDRVIRAMGRERGPWIVPAAVLGELGHLMAQRGRPSALDIFLQDIETGIFFLDAGSGDFGRVRHLVQRYEDLPLGLVDAIVIACAERNGGRVATLDMRHFGVVPAKG